MKRSNLVLSLASSLLLAQGAFADGGDFYLDFIAAVPTTYDHATGGGAYNLRTINTDVVESLEGDDFACDDVVSFLTQIRVDAGAPGIQSVRLTLGFTAYSTGQQGVALVDNFGGAGQDALINIADAGTTGDATVSVISEELTPPGTPFVKFTEFQRTVEVEGLTDGEKVVLRTDVRLICNGASPTGNMQARLVSATANFTTDPDAIGGGGNQTVPFKHVGQIKKPPPPK